MMKNDKTCPLAGQNPTFDSNNFKRTQDINSQEMKRKGIHDWKSSAALFTVRQKKEAEKYLRRGKKLEQEMALALTSLPFHSFLYPATRLPSQISVTHVESFHGRLLYSVRCFGVGTKTCDQKIVRRSANYGPPIWDYDFVQSLNSKYVGEVYEKRIAKLKEDVKIMLHEVVDPLNGLEMIDNLQRLGVFYHFEDEIDRVLESIYNNEYDNLNKEDLHATALKFRLLRQHGYNIPPVVFNEFKEDSGNFKACLCEDIKGLLSLYEASFLLVEGECVLEEARDFTAKNLDRILKNKAIDQDFAILASHSLELPLHWRVPRLEARWFVDFYEQRRDMNPTLLQLAKLDFNVVQATHQEDLKHVSRWWRKTGMGEKLSFCRDRMMENFLWTIGLNFRPQISHLRRNIAVVNALITTIDDIYDVYGTLDELDLFTNAIERWDIGAMEQLPQYMQLCFLALFNSINDMGYDTTKEQDVHIISYLHKTWAELCKSYFVEAKWYYSGYTPTLEDYTDNAWISIGAPVILTHAYFLITNPITKEGLEWLQKYPNIVQWSANILRYSNDLGTSPDEMKRGDISKCIQCYVNETGGSEEDAREHIKYLIGEKWKRMNEHRFTSSPVSRSFVEVAVNLARMSQCMYQYGDGHAAQGGDTISRILSLLINPIPII